MHVSSWIARIGLLLLASSAALPAQFLNRAIYLGDQREGMRRDYSQNVEYFLDRSSYVDLPPWWNERLEPFRNRILGIGGSVSSTELTVEARVNLSVEIGSGFDASFYYLQSENQSTQYRRTAFGLEGELSPSTSFFALIEGGAEKEYADLSLGGNLFRSDSGRVRWMLTLVDFASRKSAEFEYPDKPFGLMVSGNVEGRGGTELYFELDGQLPFEQAFADGDKFSMQRWIGLTEFRLGLNEANRLILHGYFELSDKSMTDGDSLGLEDEDVTNALGRLKLEWWHRFDPRWQLSTGFSFLQAKQTGTRPNEGSSDLREDRQEWLWLARLRWPLGGGFRLEPNIWAGLIDFERNKDGNPGAAQDSRSFQGKLGLPLVYSFSDNAQLSIMPTFQLDEAKFGGGSIQFEARF
jgi:hypothetical protein